MEKDFSKYLIWMAPNDDLVSKNIEEKVYYKNYAIGDRDHRDFCDEMLKSFCNVLEPVGGGSGHLDYARVFTRAGFMVFFNSGAKVDGKFFCTIFLPEKLSSFQKSLLLSQKEVFEMKYHSDFNMFSTLVYSSEPLEYRSDYSNFRNLKIEALIAGNENFKNGQILLFDYIDTQLINEMKKR